MGCVPPTETNDGSLGTLNVVTLNYCGIMNSPFQFYCQDYAEELAKLSSIFIDLLPRYVTNYNQKTFKWEVGKFDAKLRTRYSPLLNVQCGIENGKFVTRERFQELWLKTYLKDVKQAKLEDNHKFRQDLKLFDVVCYHSLLRMVHQVESINDAKDLSTDTYLKYFRPWFNLSFLNEEKKIEKLLKAMEHIKADIIFFQEPSPALLNELEKSGLFAIKHDPTLDTMIVVKSSSFEQVKSEEQLTLKLSRQQINSLDWEKNSCLLYVDNILLVCAHLSSKEQRNKAQVNQLIESLALLRKNHLDLAIIVGGDINSYLKPFQEQVYQMYPKQQNEFTTVKKRTMTQAQFTKGNLAVEGSKDKLITNLPLTNGKIVLISGKPAKDTIVPTDEHPFDHFMVMATMGRSLPR